MSYRSFFIQFLVTFTNSYYLCTRIIELVIRMTIIKKAETINFCTLGSKGVGRLCDVLNVLTKKNRKKDANYLVVPNNYVLSLSLSLSLSHLRTNFFSFFLACACDACCATHINKGLFGVSFVFFIYLRKLISWEFKHEIITLY